MKVTTIAPLLALCAASAAASNATSDAHIRVCDSVKPTSFCDCRADYPGAPDTVYRPRDIELAMLVAAAGGAAGYPKRNKKLEQFRRFMPDECANGDLLEYPITHGLPYTGGGPAVTIDRVVYTNEGVFCGCVAEVNEELTLHCFGET